MKNVLVLILILAGVVSCKPPIDDFPDLGPCDEFALVDADHYLNGPNDEFWLEEVNLTEDCLEVTIRYSGGCGTIVFNLVDSGAILESLPVQRNIRISLKDEDQCEALVTESKSFDLSSLQLAEENKILLNLDGWEDQILYEY